MLYIEPPRARLLLTLALNVLWRERWKTGNFFCLRDALVKVNDLWVITCKVEGIVCEQSRRQARTVTVNKDLATRLIAANL